MAMAAMGNPQNGGPDGGKVIGHVYTMLPEWNMVPIAILQFFNSMFKKGLQFHACSLCVFAVLVGKTWQDNWGSIHSLNSLIFSSRTLQSPKLSLPGAFGRRQGMQLF